MCKAEIPTLDIVPHRVDRHNNWIRKSRRSAGPRSLLQRSPTNIWGAAWVSERLSDSTAHDLRFAKVGGQHSRTWNFFLKTRRSNHQVSRHARTFTEKFTGRGSRGVCAILVTTIQRSTSVPCCEIGRARVSLMQFCNQPRRPLRAGGRRPRYDAGSAHAAKPRRGGSR